MKNILIGLGGIMIGALVLVGSYLGGKNNFALGSVNRANEYTATTTDATWMARGTLGVPLPKYVDLSGTCPSKTFGSVIITNSTLAPLTVYDATTTDPALRLINGATTATSTIILAQFPASVAAGTYTFDVHFRNGLTVEPFSTSTGTVTGVASTTITCR